MIKVLKMKYGKHFLVICILILLFGIASVTASDMNESVSDEAPISAENSDMLSVELQDENEMAENEGESLTAESGTFTDLANEIGNSSDEFTLTRNYTYSDGDEDYKNGIVIDKLITIDGNGFTIDASNQARHFYVTGSGNDDEDCVLIKNIVFINGYSSSDGGSIKFSNSEFCELKNCTFINNSAYCSGAIDADSGTFCINVNNCTFINNSASTWFSAVNLKGAICSIKDSTFINNTKGAYIIGFGSEGGMNGNYFDPFNGAVSSEEYGDGRDLVFVKGKCEFECRDISMYYLENNVSVTLKDLNNVALKGRNVVFNKKGNYDELYNAVTDDDGAAFIPSELLGAPGNYTIIASYKGDLNYEKCQGQINLEIKPSNKAVGTYTDLAYEIKSVTDEFTLTRNYAYSEGDEKYKDGIPIEKGIAIDGNGFTIDASSQARHFNTTFYFDDEYPIIIRNLRFINGNSTSDGGSVNFGYRDECKFINCTFINNHADNNGGAISWFASTIQIDNCTFINNSADNDGGALWCEADNFLLQNSVFINNSANNSGGAIQYCGEQGFIDKSTFIGNAAENCGAVSMIAYDYGTLRNSNFINNTGNYVVILDVESGELYHNTYYPYFNTVSHPPTDFHYYDEDEGEIWPFSLVKSYGSKIICNDTAINYLDDINITLRLIDSSNSNPLENRSIAFYKEIIDGNKDYYYSTTDDNGYAVMPSELIGTPGDYTIHVEFDGDDNYGKRSNKFILTVNPIPTEIECTDAVVDYFDDIVSICLKDSNGTGLSDRVVIFSNGDMTVNVTTDEIGVAKMPSEFVTSAGNHTISVRFIGDDIYKASENAFDLTVNPIPTVIECSDAVVDYLDDSVSVCLKDSNGTGLKDMIVVFSNGDMDVNATTDENGVARMPSGFVNAGNHTISVRFDGYLIYSPSENTFALTVNPLPTAISASSITTVYNGGKYLTVTLRDQSGKLLDGKRISVNLNGMSPLTTKDGQVKFLLNSLAPNRYTVKVSFAGDNNYLATSKSVVVTVKKATPKITAKAKTFKAKAKTKKYTITLKCNNKVMKKAKVTLKINGKRYKATTNARGKATFKIKKLTKKATYRAVIKFAGSKYYNKATKKVYIKVKK